MRRAVVGDAYVDRALAQADDFAMPMEELVTPYCWREVFKVTEI